MRKALLLIASITLLWSCSETGKNTATESNNTNTSVTQNRVPYDTLVGLQGFDSAYVEYKGDTTILKYENWTLTTFTEEHGEVVLAKSHKTGKTDRICCYDFTEGFMGLYKNYAMLYEGTDMIGTYTVFNINTKEKQKTFDAFERPTLEDGVLTIHQVDDLTSDVEAPDCPDAEKWKAQGADIRYTEKVLYKIEENATAHLSEYKCFPLP